MATGSDSHLAVLLHVEIVVVGDLEIELRQRDVRFDRRLDCSIAMPQPLEGVVIGGHVEGVEDDVAHLLVEGEHAEVHPAGDVKVYPVGENDGLVLVQSDGDWFDQQLGLSDILDLAREKSNFQDDASSSTWSMKTSGFQNSLM
jgi:hypothetical protein